MYLDKTISPAILYRFARKNILLFTVLSGGVYWLYYVMGVQVYVPFIAIGTVGTAVAILLGFRNNSAYERFWEARTAWGGLVNQSRSFARQLFSVAFQPVSADETELTAIRRQIIRRHLAFINALRLDLRKGDAPDPGYWNELRSLLTEADWQQVVVSPNKPNTLLNIQSEHFTEQLRAENSDLFRVIQMENHLTEFSNLQGRCERIKRTPLPRQYAYFTRVFVWIFVVLIPFGLVRELDWLTVPASVLLSWIFITIEQVGAYTENPFANDINDVPMSALCRTIEIDMSDRLNETAPQPLQPVGGILM